MRTSYLAIALALALALPSSAGGASVLIPRDNHFIYPVKSFWNFFKREETVMRVKARVASKVKVPTQMVCRAELVKIDYYGKVSPTGQYLEVEPEVITIFPNRIQAVSITWPLPAKDGSVAVMFTVMTDHIADERKGLGIKVSTGAGQFLMLTKAVRGWKPQVTITPEWNRGKLFVTISNPTDYGFIGVVEEYKGDEVVNARPNFFLMPHGARKYAVEDKSADGLVVDIGLDRKFGRHLPPRYP